MNQQQGEAVVAERVSVVVCSYQGEQWLREQLDSIAQQDRRPDQIIISDDNSTDGSVAIAATFAERARALGIEVQLLRHTQTLGFVGNFAAALAQADGDIVFLSDQDDLWPPTRVRTYLQRFTDAPGLQLLHSDARLVDALAQPLGTTLFEANRVHPAELRRIHAGAAMEVLALRNVVTGATCAVRRTLLRQALPIPTGWLHDEWLGLVAGANAGMDVIEATTIDYRQHGGNQIGARRMGPVERLRRMTALQPRRRALARPRLDALLVLLAAHRPSGIPLRWRAAPALAWALARWRIALYREPDVAWGWIAHDLPRLLVRISGVCWLGGQPLRSTAAALAGAWRGLWRRLD